MFPRKPLRLFLNNCGGTNKNHETFVPSWTRSLEFCLTDSETTNKENVLSSHQVLIVFPPRGFSNAILDKHCTFWSSDKRCILRVAQTCAALSWCHFAQTIQLFACKNSVQCKLRAFTIRVISETLTRSRKKNTHIVFISDVHMFELSDLNNKPCRLGIFQYVGSVLINW